MRTARNPSRTDYLLVKLLSVFVVLAMLVQIIKPLGVPGLRRRSDFWKLPLAGLFAIILISALQL